MTSTYEVRAGLKASPALTTQSQSEAFHKMRQMRKSYPGGTPIIVFKDGIPIANYKARTRTANKYRRIKLSTENTKSLLS